jgi:hypothetical protein
VVTIHVARRSCIRRKWIPIRCSVGIGVDPCCHVGYLMCRKKAPVEPSEKNTLPPGRMWSGLSSEQPGIPRQDEAVGLVLDEAGQAGGGYMPRNKDQARSFALEPHAEVSGVAVSPGPSNNHDYRPRGAEPSDIYAEPDMTTNDYLPQGKDQCREVPAERQAIPHRLPLRSLFNMMQ